MSNKYLTKLAAKTDIAAAGTGLDNTHKAPRVTLKQPEKPIAASMTMPRAMPTLDKEAGVVDKVKGFGKFLGELRPEDKIKLGLSSAGLGLGAAGFATAQHQRAKDERRRDLEAQSLATLRKIHQSLASKSELK